jgi:peptide/nickel transport system ATP-binding protein
MAANINTDFLLHVTDLEVRFPSPSRYTKARWIVPVNHVSFDLKRRETVGLVGESGSGKTTAGKTLVRLLKPWAGHIVYKGEDVARWTGSKLHQYHKSAQLIFQDPYGSLNPVHTVSQHLALPLQLHQKGVSGSLEDKIEALLDRVGLVPAAEIRTKYPHELSGGQRQRVAIARALAVNPEFMVADEPISMLDVSIRADILHLLQNLQKDFALSMVYITHDLASARYISDRILVMYGGTIVESGDSQDIVKQPAHPYTQLLLAATPGSPVTGPLPETTTGAPNLLLDRQGCVFYQRCPHAMDRCRTEVPALKDVAHGHAAACHLYNDQRPSS